MEIMLNLKLYNKKGSVCWMCGNKLRNPHKSKHHIIPRAIKPEINMLVPLHIKCHRRLNKMFRVHKEEVMKWCEEREKK